MTDSELIKNNTIFFAYFCPHTGIKIYKYHNNSYSPKRTSDER